MVLAQNSVYDSAWLERDMGLLQDLHEALAYLEKQTNKQKQIYKNYMMTKFVRNIISCIQALKHWKNTSTRENCNLDLRDLLTNTKMTITIFTWRSVVGASVDGLLLHGGEAPLALHS